MYSISLVSSVVTLNTPVTEKSKKCNEVYCIKTHEHCIVFYYSLQSSAAIPNTSYSDQSLKA